MKETDLKEVGCKDMDWIRVAHEKGLCYGRGNELRVP
jgi:hypothetical protein